jgi:hypothetical protein
VKAAIWRLSLYFETMHTEHRLSRAIFTVVRHEPVLLPVWLAHHHKTFEHIYVLFHQYHLPDELVACRNYNATPLIIHNPTSYCWAWITATANEFAKFLLQSYKIVVYADVDEFLVDSGGVLDKTQDKVVRCNGISVLHHYPKEPRLNPAVLLSKQRGFYTCGPELCKPVIKTDPDLLWDMGFHFLKRHPDLPVCQGVSLVHLHYMDYNLMVRRHIMRGQFDRVSEWELQGQYGSHNFVEHPGAIARILNQWEPKSRPVTQEIACILDSIDLSQLRCI